MLRGNVGNTSLVAIVLTVEEGDVFTPETLARIERITRRLDGDDYEPHVEERKELREKLEAQGLTRARCSPSSTRSTRPIP